MELTRNNIRPCYYNVENNRIEDNFCDDPIQDRELANKQYVDSKQAMLLLENLHPDAPNAALTFRFKLTKDAFDGVKFYWNNIGPTTISGAAVILTGVLPVAWRPDTHFDGIVHIDNGGSKTVGIIEVAPSGTVSFFPTTNGGPNWGGGGSEEIHSGGYVLALNFS